MIPSRRHSLYFTAPRRVEIRKEPLIPPAADEVLVQTQISAISPGTEMLFYRGQIPAGMSADATIAALASAVTYPLKYGYACAGEVIAAGSAVEPSWVGRRVFAFHPHESHFCAPPNTLIPFPFEMEMERAALLPNAETAVNLVMDGAPLIGESIVVFGQGIVGLMVTKLLAAFPLGGLYAVDPLERRLALAQEFGAIQTFVPAGVARGELLDILGDLRADLIFELSGNPSALNEAIRHTGFGGRTVIGSWYGAKQAPIDLGGHFHRSRIQILSSQVSTIASHLQARWNKARRLFHAWTFLPTLPLDQLITHRFPIDQAADAYALVDQCPEEAVQVVFEY
ncbi:MAG: zinc-binding alcohol dehydrogenase [Caldilineaceae bacterium]|nr:zinc-binding alcohol dehydrogenase [Caldilineaceae bacterium]